MASNQTPTNNSDAWSVFVRVNSRSPPLARPNSKNTLVIWKAIDRFLFSWRSPNARSNVRPTNSITIRTLNALPSDNSNFKETPWSMLSVVLRSSLSMLSRLLTQRPRTLWVRLSPSPSWYLRTKTPNRFRPTLKSPGILPSLYVLWVYCFNFSMDETLLYSPEWDLAERRFYMWGDEEIDVKRVGIW